MTFNEWDTGVIVPIQIREDHWVRVGRIPHDLTPTEAKRICAVITAYASGTEACRANSSALSNISGQG